MVLSRVMPCLLYDGRALVKTVRFRKPAYVGDPVNAVKIFNEKEVDELVLLDITAAKRGAHAFGGPAAIAYAGRKNSDVVDGMIKKNAPPAQLYDLEADLGQTTNLHNEYPEVVRELSELLNAYAPPKATEAGARKKGKGQKK